MDRIDLTEDLSFSRIVYGTWRLDEDDTSPANIRSKLHACLDQGITTIDQADIYGGYMAEEHFGNALKDFDDKAKLEIVTKCDIVAPAGRHSGARVKHYDTSRRHIEASVEASLGLMGIETIDLLLIHRPDPLMDHEETGATLDDLIASGKIRAAGVSNFKPWDFSLLQSAMENDLLVNQIELSLSSHEPFTNGDIAFLQENGIVPMAWSPLGGGDLVTGRAGDAMNSILARVAEENGVDLAAVAVAWLLAHPSRIVPVMGTNTIARIEKFSDALKVEMDRQTWFELYTAALGREVA